MKNINFISTLVALILILCFAYTAHSEVIEFPTEELARESVLPKFKHNKSVMNKNIPLEGRVEVNLAAGFALNEAYYNPLSVGGGATYYLTDIHGINLSVNQCAEGVSSYAKQLQSGEGLKSGTFDPSLAPSAERLVLLNYQYSAFYGKISLTKQGVMNLAVYGLLGGGAIQIGSTNALVINFGVGQKFYFSPNWALRMDLNLYSYNAPDPASIPLLTGSAERTYNDFDIKNYISSNISLGLSFLF